MSVAHNTAAVSSVIDAGTDIGVVTLRVSQIERSLRLYKDILGFQVIEQTAGRVVLGGQERKPILALVELVGADPEPVKTTGLFHHAIRLPSRADLGQVLIRLKQAGLDIIQKDHAVSEALYISDPDEIGIEIFRDRPKETWTWVDGKVIIRADIVDLEDLEREARTVEAWDVLPAGTQIGHVHLKVGNLEETTRFYVGVLGFAITAGIPGNLFMSAGGYHHHIAVNVWDSLGEGPNPLTSAGMEKYEITLPTRAALQAVKERLLANSLDFEEGEKGLIRVNDPWSNVIELRVRGEDTV